MRKEEREPVEYSMTVTNGVDVTGVTLTLRREEEALQMSDGRIWQRSWSLEGGERIRVHDGRRWRRRKRWPWRPEALNPLAPVEMER